MTQASVIGTLSTHVLSDHQVEEEPGLAVAAAEPGVRAEQGEPGVLAEPGLAIEHSVLDLARGRDMVLDADQRAVLTQLAQFLGRALAQQPAGPVGPAGPVEPAANEQVGFFVYGPAGRGKTWLHNAIMDAIVDSLPLPAQAAQRVHFHTFFRHLQARFGALVSTREAIEQTVDELLAGTRVFFFDELHVHDPASASLLNRLLEELVTRRIPTLITSNYAPEALLPHRVYHHVMEPGIRLLRAHCAVVEMDGGADYRRMAPAPPTAFASGMWVVSPDVALGAQLAGLEAPGPQEATSVLKDHHALRASAVRGRQVWFSFADLLEVPSIAQNYLDLVDFFDHLVVTHVPALSQVSRAARARWVNLLDVLVDQDCRLTVISSVPRDKLVDIADVPADLFRAESRLALLAAVGEA